MLGAPAGLPSLDVRARQRNSKPLDTHQLGHGEYPSVGGPNTQMPRDVDGLGSSGIERTFGTVGRWVLPCRGIAKPEAWSSTNVGYELIGVGMLIVAGTGRGLPSDNDELERWTRVGYERRTRFRKDER